MAIDAKLIDKITLGHNERHMMLCVEESCGGSQGQKSWAYLKKRLREEGLDRENVLRSKVGCLRICVDGPIAIIYPEGVWYHSVDEALIDQLIESNFKKGIVLDRNIFARDDLRSKSGK